MGCIGNTDYKRAEQSTSKSIPESGQYDGQIVEALKDVVKIGKFKRCKIVQHADAYDERE